MNKEEILDLILDIDLLSKYTEFIPTSYKSTYNQSLTSIKTRLQKLKDEILPDYTFNDNEEIKIVIKPDYKTIRTFLPSEIYTEIFDDVLDCIKPVIDNQVSDLSLKELFRDQDKSFLEFIEYYQKLDQENKISFIKNGNIANRGWIKIGEILINSLIINLDSLKLALETQSNKPGLFLGEVMIELKIITENILRKALKTQRWIFKISEK